MNRRALLWAAAAGALAACSRPNPQAAEEAEAPAAPDPADTIRPIYAPYMSENSTFPQFRDQAPWSSDLWARIEEMIRRSNEINEPILNFDPVINAQDGLVSDLVVTTDGVVENSHATVRARFVNLGRQEEILFDMIWEDGGWRVNNIRNADWDLRTIVTEGGPALPAASGEGK